MRIRVGPFGDMECSRQSYLKELREMLDAKAEAERCRKIRTKPGYEAIITNTLKKNRD